MTNLEIFRMLGDKTRAALFVHGETSIIDYCTFYYTMDGCEFKSYNAALEHTLAELARLPQPITETPANTVARMLVEANRYYDGLFPSYQLPDNSEVRTRKKAVAKTLHFLLEEHHPEKDCWW